MGTPFASRDDFFGEFLVCASGHLSRAYSSARKLYLKAISSDVELSLSPAVIAYEKDAIDKAIIAVLDTVGLEMWRDKQKECIRSFVLGQDTFVVLPTGYGKSLIFGCLPLFTTV